MTEKKTEQPAEQPLPPTATQQALDHSAQTKAMEDAMLKRLRGAALANALRNWKA